MKKLDITPGLRVQVAGHDGKCRGHWTVISVAGNYVKVERDGQIREVIYTRIKPAEALTYMASPYSHTDPAVRQLRFEQVCEAAACLMRRGLMIYSPIAHTHPIALAGDIPKTWDFWRPYDSLMMDACRGIVVLMLDGWRESEGVQAEIEYMRRRGIAAEFLAWEDVR